MGLRVHRETFLGEGPSKETLEESWGHLSKKMWDFSTYGMLWKRNGLWVGTISGSHGLLTLWGGALLLEEVKGR